MANILVVDDAAFMRIMLKDILTKGGHQIVGEARRPMVLKPSNNLTVTMDITMPEMEGIDALKLIKQKKTAHDLWVRDVA